LVSIIFSFLNEERYIRYALDSLLNQTYTDIEIIAIDDGSTDSSSKIINEYMIMDSRIRLISFEQNMGLAYARNVGLENARGEYIGFFDADDIACLDKLEKQVDFLNMHPEIVAVGGAMDYIDSEGNQIKEKGYTKMLTNPMFIRATLMFQNCMNCGSVLFRRDLIETYKIGMDNELSMVEDWHFWCSCIYYGNFTNLPDVLYHYRFHDSQTVQMIKKNQILYNQKSCKVLRYAWKKNGVELTEEELFVIFKYFHKRKLWSSNKEVAQTYRVLSDINTRLQNAKIENASEVATVFRKRFAELMQTAFCLWGQESPLEYNYDDIVLE